MNNRIYSMDGKSYIEFFPVPGQPNKYTLKKNDVDFDITEELTKQWNEGKFKK